MPVHTCVAECAEMEGIGATGGILFFFWRMYLWCSLYTLYLLARQVELS